MYLKTKIGLSLALLLSTGLVSIPVAQNSSLIINGTVVSDVYFYGESPPIYPSPLGNGTGDWADAYAKAAALVSQLIVDEKVSDLTIVVRNRRLIPAAG